MNPTGKRHPVEEQHISGITPNIVKFEAPEDPFMLRGGYDYVKAKPTLETAISSPELLQALRPFTIDAPIEFVTGSERKRAALRALGIGVSSVKPRGDDVEIGAALYPNQFDVKIPPFNASVAAQNAYGKSPSVPSKKIAEATNDTTLFFPYGKEYREYYDSIRRKEQAYKVWLAGLKRTLARAERPRLFVDNATCINHNNELTWIMFLLEFSYNPDALIELIQQHPGSNLPLATDLATLPPEVGQLEHVRLVPARFDYNKDGFRTDRLHIEVIDLGNDTSLASLCHGIAPATATVINALSNNRL